MNRLSCNVNKCSHNLFGMCEMNRINVNGNDSTIKNETTCNSFEKRNIFKRINHIGEIEIFSDRLKEIDFIDNNNNRLPQIDCMAGVCMYNEDFICNSRIVFIEGFRAKNIKDTNCASFKI